MINIFKKAEQWLIKKIPAQRKMAETARTSAERNKKISWKTFDNLSPEDQKSVLNDPTAAIFVDNIKREVASKHENR